MNIYPTRKSLRREASQIIEDQVYPSYRKLKEFLQNVSDTLNNYIYILLNFSLFLASPIFHTAVSYELLPLKLLWRP